MQVLVNGEVVNAVKNLSLADAIEKMNAAQQANNADDAEKFGIAANKAAALEVFRLVSGGKENATYTLAGRFLQSMVADEAKRNGHKSKELNRATLNALIDAIDDEDIQPLVDTFKSILASVRHLSNPKYKSPMGGGLSPVVVGESALVYIAPEGSAAQRDTAKATITRANIGK